MQRAPGTGPRRLRTANRMGWASTELSELSRAFVEFAASAASPGPALDIGGAPGYAIGAAHAAGAVESVANDLDAALFTALPPGVAIKTGRFPRELHFEPRSFGAIHASNVLHFLTPAQLSEGFRAVARWLRPGGKLFVQASTPYQAPFRAFIEEFERRRASGQPWPGWLAKASEFATHRQMGQMPRSLHLLDDETLARAARDVELEVERAWLFRRADFPRTLHLDGRETAALIARRKL